MKNEYQDKLSHLTKKEIEELISRYYNGEKNSVLINEYKIDIKSSLLLKTFPPKIHLNKLCPYCDIPMFSYRVSKSSYSSKEIIFCKECKHELDSLHCSCKGCKEARLEQERLLKERKERLEYLKREIILDTYKIEKEYPVDISELDIKMKLYLSALLRTSLSEDLKDINPVSSSSLKLTPITPNSKYEIKIISFLKDNRLIIFSPNTDTDSVIIEDNEIVSYIPEEATYRLNVYKDESAIEIESLLYFEDEEVEEIDSETLLEIWLEIGLYECLEYLYIRLKEFNLPSEYIGEKTISAIKEALNHFSISQVFYFVWNASKNADAFYKKGGGPKKYAVNLIAGRISRTMDRAIINNWDIKKYGRGYNYPQSIISEVFFNRVLKIGDEGFDSVAKEYFIIESCKEKKSIGDDYDFIVIE